MKKQILASLILVTLSASAFALPETAQQPINITPIAADGADRTGVNRVAEDGFDRTNVNRLAEDGSDNTAIGRIS